MRNRYIDSFGRPDIVTFDSNNLSNTELDISLAHPFNKELVRSSASLSGHAASIREKEKKEKYHQRQYPGGIQPEVTPLVFEHFGRWGQDAIDFLKSLATRSRDEYGHSNKTDFLSLWRRRLSTTLQKANAKVILKKVDRLVNSSSLPVSADFDFTTQSYVH